MSFFMGTSFRKQSVEDTKDLQDIGMLIEKNVASYTMYIFELKRLLQHEMQFKSTEDKDKDKTIKKLYFTPKKIDEICETMIREGRFHDNCALDFRFQDFTSRLYFRGTDRWGWDLSITLGPADCLSAQ